MITTQTATTQQMTDAYFTAWVARDPVAMRKVLDDQVNFKGPMGVAHDADGVIAGFSRLSQTPSKGPFVIKTWVDGEDSLTWFEMRNEGYPVQPIVNWLTVKNGLVTRIRVIYCLKNMERTTPGWGEQLQTEFGV